MSYKPYDLTVVMPVYNEEGAIAGVLRKWMAVLDTLGIRYRICAYNDGSKDGTRQILEKTASESRGHIVAVNKANSGHGPTILRGYREAAECSDWIFQIDSDDEMGPESFPALWRERGRFDFLVGYRAGRQQPLSRKIVSAISRWTVGMFYGKSIWDVNTPYRLMRAQVFKNIYRKIPDSTFAPNVILSGAVARGKFRYFEMPVPQHDRTTGEVSIKKWKLLKAAARSFGQTILFALKTATAFDWLRYCGYALLLALALVSVPIGFINGFREFDFQWDPAKLLMMGENPYLYSLEHKAITHEGFLSPYIDANQVPSCLLLLAPFTFLPQLLANQVWDVCNLIFTFLLFLFVYKIWFARDRMVFEDPKPEYLKSGFTLLVLLILAGTPWRVLIGNGQHLLFSLSFFLMGLYYALQGKSNLSGILVAISLFKYTTIFPLLLIFVFIKRFRPLIVAGALHLFATVLAGIYLETSPVTLVLQSLQVGSSLSGDGSSDFASFFRYLGGELSVVKLIANLGYLFYSVLLLICTFSGKGRLLLRLAIFAIVSNVMFYHRCYDLITSIFPILYYMSVPFRSDEKTSRKNGVIICSIWVFWTFFAGKKLLVVFGYYPSDALGCAIQLVLQHLLLISLLLNLFSKEEECPSRNC